MYKPKVGDVLKSKTNKEAKITILSTVANMVLYHSVFGQNIVCVSAEKFTRSITELDWIFPKEKFMPKVGDEYFMPDLYDNCGYCSLTYTRKGGYDDIKIETGIIFATKEEAIECREIMLKAIK